MDIVINFKANQGRVEQRSARRSHKPEVAGSNPAPAPKPEPRILLTSVGSRDRGSGFLNYSKKSNS